MEFDEEFKESQRVSELASHLMKTGVVASHMEAETRAKEMIYGKVQATAAKPEAPKPQDSDYIKMLEMSHNIMMKELAAVKYKQDQLLSEILMLKGELSKVQIQAAARERQVVQPQAAPEPQVQKEASAPVPQITVPAAQPAPQAAPKKTNPDDISIEKYFYFGQKK